jgi:uncharacterized protein DUF3540
MSTNEEIITCEETDRAASIDPADPGRSTDSRSLGGPGVPGLRLSPAEVLRCAGREVQVRCGAEVGWAELALSFHRPEPGDRVLVASDATSRWVIGVLDAAPARLRIPGDLELEAPAGRIRLRAAHGVEIETSRFELRADRFETLVRTAVHKCADLYQSVRSLFDLRAGRIRTLVEGASVQRAEQTYIRSRRETKIDGEKIHLG